AKMLHIDNRVGSLKVGKDADIVVWDNNPLSIYAKVEKTFVDGILLFDREKHEEALAKMNEDKSRLIQKCLDAKSKGAKTKKYNGKKPRLYHCNTLEGINESETGKR
ncbi:MAG: amidohydrolase family protein, partial [Bacteroidia bacterium]